MKGFVSPPRDWIRAGAPTEGEGVRFACLACDEDDVEIRQVLSVSTLVGLMEGFCEAHDDCGPIGDGDSS